VEVATLKLIVTAQLLTGLHTPPVGAVSEVPAYINVLNLFELTKVQPVTDAKGLNPATI
jgi:hypothetical protein